MPAALSEWDSVELNSCCMRELLLKESADTPSNAVECPVNTADWSSMRRQMQRRDEVQPDVEEDRELKYAEENKCEDTFL